MNYSLLEIIENLDAHRHKGLHVWIDDQCRFIDYATVKADVKRMMAELSGWGVRSGMNIGIAAKNSYEWMVTDLAVLAMGARLVAIPEELPLEPEVFATYSLQLLLVSSAERTGVDTLDSSVAFLDAPNSAGIHNIRDDVPIADYGVDGLTITFSSGTSGDLKAMVISRDGAEHWIAYLVSSFGLTADGSILIFLPFSHFQQRMLFYVAVLLGMDFMLTTPERLFGALLRLAPSMVVAPPMFYESVEMRVRSGSAGAATGSDARNTINRVLGSRIRWLFTGFAPSRKDTLEFYDQIGLPLFEGYGVTECGQICLNTPAAHRTGSVGKPVDDAVIELADDGEITVRKQHPLSLGYVGRQALSSFAGWFSTGDIGRFDEDGFLYVVGRKKELIVTRGGYKVHPQVVEEKLNACGHIQKAVIFGNNMPALVALLSVAPSTTESQKEEIRGFIKRLNSEVVSARRIGKIVFTDRVFDEQSGFLTRSLKLNRAAVFDAFKTEIMGNWES